MIITVIGCQKSYRPPAIVAPGSYLVVEGVINAGPGKTTIMLSKTVDLSSSNTVNPVLNATIMIESDKGASYPVPGAGRGKYISAEQVLDITAHYRLHIKTADNHEYFSDFVPVTNAPPVDNVSFEVKNNGIQIYVSSHDPTNTTRFYRWEYEETWVLHTAYFSLFKSNGDTVLDRDLENDQIYQCWRSDTSTTITLASSSGLSADVINNAPITFIEAGSRKLDGKQSQVFIQKQPETNAYTILVKQFALTGDAYRYWANLKKNTQDIGKIFDPQPTEIRGNIHSVTDPLEPVLGYISAGTTTTKRLFIANGDIPTLWTLNTPYDACKIDSLFLDTLLRGNVKRVNQENTAFNLNRGTEPAVLQIPVYGIYNPLTGTIIGHTGSSPYCVDCTLQGTNKVPDFWRFTNQ
ncbi:DUF4249 domain-containing protein [Mucilaginibacter ginsenosidivorans]|uniref:DUF4249 domain-containing protein n=1 Tax=Mucilaginibacter ginsenosidivorans TaxID=398053 RepID=UPI001651BA8B|nr:DUF4249 domain-containing protein [Mucilaginibacter ginsenosidivorans]